jgi:hypothetical protein
VATAALVDRSEVKMIISTTPTGAKYVNRITGAEKGALGKGR